MRRTLLLSLFVLATLAWAAAQQQGSDMRGDAGQAASPSTRSSGASESQVPSTDSAGQNAAAVGTPSGAPADPTIVQGCLGGANPNYTVTDQAGKTYKLNIPADADASSLAAHVGEPVAVLGAVNGGAGASLASIDVHDIARGKGACPTAGNSNRSTPSAQNSRQ